MLSGVSANQIRMKAGNYRTIGEMVANDDAFTDAKRNKGGDYNHTFSRLDLAAELTTLFTAQRNFANPHATAEIEQKLQFTLMARRPTLSGDNLLKMIGHCTFETNEYRAPKASHSAERFVWLTKLNNLRITAQGETRGLFAQERTLLIDLPFTQAKLTYKQVRSKLGLNDNEKFIGLAYRHDKDIESSTSLFEAKAFHMLRKAYTDANLNTQWQRDSIDSTRLDSLAYAQTVLRTIKRLVTGYKLKALKLKLSKRYSMFLSANLFACPLRLSVKSYLIWHKVSVTMKRFNRQVMTIIATSMPMRPNRTISLKSVKKTFPTLLSIARLIRHENWSMPL